MFWQFLIGFALIYATQTVLALRQSKNYTTTYTSMRRRGRVAIGKKKGLLTTGAIVMFLIDDDGMIVEGTRITRVTVMARFRPFATFDGLLITDLDASDDRQLTGSVRAAVNNARDNFLFASTGNVPPEPPGPLTQLADRFRKLIRRPRRVTLQRTPSPTSLASTPGQPSSRTRIPVPGRK